MGQRVIILVLSILFFACNSSKDYSDFYRLDNNGDTLEVIKKYSDGAVREIVTYKNGRPFSNVGFYNDGKPIMKPVVVSLNQDTMLFAYMPMKMNIQSYRLLIAVDSAKVYDSLIRKVLDDICGELIELKGSTTFPFNKILLHGDSLRGVFQCKLDTGTGAYFDYHPFTVIGL